MGNMAFDVYGITKIIKQGIAHRLELVETAITKISPTLEPLSVIENFAFIANTKTGQLLRLRYQINEQTVIFSNPVAFNIEEDSKRFEEEGKRITRNIVEALAENDQKAITEFQSQWLDLQRKKYQLESKLSIRVGTRSEYISNAKRIVEDAVNTSRGGKSLLKKAGKSTLFSQLLEDGEIAITPETKSTYVAPKSRKTLIYSQIVEGRNSAKTLSESPVFREYAKNLVLNEDAEEAAEFIGDNYQEVFCLSMAEQTELFYNTVSRQSYDITAEQVVEGLLRIREYALGNMDIRDQLVKLTQVVEADGNFHERMQIIEDTVNTKTYTNNDVNVLKTVIEKVLAQPSELLAPEFITELRKAYNRICEMVENGNYDDSLVAATVHLLSNFYPQTIKIGESEEYEQMFREKLSQQGVSSPADLTDDQRAKFFDEVDAAWDAENETDSDKDSVSDMHKTPSGVVGDDDKHAEETIYGKGKAKAKSKEVCDNCGSPKCICDGL